MAGAGAIPNVASDMICKLQKQNNLGEFKKEVNSCFLYRMQLLMGKNLMTHKMSLIPLI